MAERRMFAKTIVDSDAFLDMPLTAQALYFHLSMRADDDGFVNNPKKIQRIIGCAEDDIKLLIAKNFIIPFENGVVVIKHWRIHNYIQKDRYKPTVYQEQYKQLEVKNNKAYTLKKTSDTDSIQDVYNTDTQVRLGKVSIELNKNILLSNDNNMSVDTDTESSLIIDFNAILKYWNEKSMLNEITKITDKRKKHLTARIKEHGIEAIFKVIDNCGQSKFMRGENKKGWMASFDWVFSSPNNFLKVLEGNYIDRRNNDINKMQNIYQETMKNLEVFNDD